MAKLVAGMFVGVAVGEHLPVIRAEYSPAIYRRVLWAGFLAWLTRRPITMLSALRRAGAF